jgi:aryl carrier-like protein
MDRKALAQFFFLHEKSIPDFGDSMLHQDVMDPQARPQTELQLIIRSLWSSVLGCQESSLGLDDDFYAVGGDSISAIYIANAARIAGLQLLATDIIRNPTLRAMAKIAEAIVTYNELDDDDAIPSMMLDHMSPQDLTLLVLDQYSLDSLRDELLQKHGISARSVLHSLLTQSLAHDHSFPVMSLTFILLPHSKQAF